MLLGLAVAGTLGISLIWFASRRRSRVEVVGPAPLELAAGAGAMNHRAGVGTRRRPLDPLDDPLLDPLVAAVGRSALERYGLERYGHDRAREERRSRTTPDEGWDLGGAPEPAASPVWVRRLDPRIVVATTVRPEREEAPADDDAPPRAPAAPDVLEEARSQRRSS
ncbi:MAG TPA: hypothetical protein VIV06_08380 [Candidatus Limnocylindrales bacterium]